MNDAAVALLSRCMQKENHLQSIQLHLFHFLPQTENKGTLVVPSATGKLRRGELGRGRNTALNYKVTRENQSLLELSWHWRHRTEHTADQWVSLGRKGKEEGSRAGHCNKESVPCCVQITPKVVGDPVTCSDVLFKCSHAYFGCMSMPHLPGIWLWN